MHLAKKNEFLKIHKPFKNEGSAESNLLRPFLNFFYQFWRLFLYLELFRIRFPYCFVFSNVHMAKMLFRGGMCHFATGDDVTLYSIYFEGVNVFVKVLLILERNGPLDLFIENLRKQTLMLLRCTF